MVKTVTVLGARPQFIKAAPVLELLKNDILIHTGQHYDTMMSDIFFKDLNIKHPDHNIEVGSGSLAYQLSNMILRLEQLIIEVKPDYIIVYGDTNSTLAGALAGRSANVPVIHIEAGLRSYDITMPEEMNRIFTDKISSKLFCPTNVAYENLKKENLDHNAYIVGDTMLDLLIKYKSKYNKELLYKYDLTEKDYYLCTLHRPINVDNKDKLAIIFDTFECMKKKILLPIHPRTEKSIINFEIDIPDNVKMIDPVSYIDMITFIAGAEKVLTDSGGIQKEAHILETPCVTLRDSTEWIESVASGWNMLTSIQKDSILQACNHIFPLRQLLHSYGDGNAAKNIVELINES